MARAPPRVDGRSFRAGVGGWWRPGVRAPSWATPFEVGASNPSRRLCSTRAGKAWIVVALNGEVIRNRILPDLAHRYFQGTDGLDYLVAVVAGRLAA